MNNKSNRKFKDSGIEWIGKIPAEWNVERLQWHLFEINEKNDPIKTTDVLSLTNKKGVLPYEEKGNQGNKSKENYNEYKIAYKDTIIANSMNILIGSVGYSNFYGCVSPVYYVFKEYKNNNLRFFNYILSASEFQRELKKYANGILEIRLRLSSNDILKRIVPIPNYKEQCKIADFLDEKCSKIHKIINDINKQIETLVNYKKTLINDLVTGKKVLVGAKLCEPEKTKDSGIEWIGKIPYKWDIMKIKHNCWLKGRIGWDGLTSAEYLDEGPFLITGTDFENGYVNWNTCVHISEERFREDSALHIFENDLLITKDGTIGKLAIAKNCPNKVSLNSGVMLIRNIGKYLLHSRYLYYVLSSNQFYLWYELSQSGNSTIRHLYQEQFYNFSYTYPIYEVQMEIANFLDNKCSKIDKIISDKKQQIESLEKYKKSIIFEYVTGKKQV